MKIINTYENYCEPHKIDHLIVFNYHYNSELEVNIHRVSYPVSLDRDRSDEDGVLGVWHVKYKTTETPFG